jgi:hypothetical protein
MSVIEKEEEEEEVNTTTTGCSNINSNQKKDTMMMRCDDETSSDLRREGIWGPLFPFPLILGKSSPHYLVSFPLDGSNGRPIPNYDRRLISTILLSTFFLFFLQPIIC